MTGEPGEGPPDSRLDPERSPGFGSSAKDLSDIEVSRDVTIGTAAPGELAATDTEPVADANLDELCATLEEGDRIERRRAAVALGQRPPTTEAIDPLSSAVLEDPDADVRQFAVEALATHGDGSAVSAVQSAATDDDPWVRAEAVVALDRIDREGNAAFLESKLRDDHQAVRRNAMISLYKLRGDDALETLLSGLEDPGERVREWAAEFLGGIDDDRARRALSETAATDESAMVRTTAQRALGEELESPTGQGRGGSSGANIRQAPGKTTGTDDADGLNEPPDL